MPDDRAPPAPASKQQLFGISIDCVGMAGALQRCREALRTRRTLLIGVVNAAKIVRLRQDSTLRDAILDCDLVLADGQAVVWASKLLRRPLPERVAGIDLFEELLALADAEHRSVYLLGAKPDVLRRLENRIAQRWPGVVIAGSRHGYFTDGEAADVAGEIHQRAPDMLFLGMASPKKEVFLRRFRSMLEVPILHGVGGSFDVLAGMTMRAPPAWQRAGMEWAYRLLQEPGRMWRRYLVTNSAFIAMTLREAVWPSPLLERGALSYPAVDNMTTGPSTK